MRQRLASRHKMESSLMQMVIGSVFDKKAGKQLANIFKRLDESD